MSGSGQLFIQPSTAYFSAAGVGVGAWQRAVPVPGDPNAVFAPFLPAVGGVPDCRNLLSSSPPTLLEAYELYGLAIGFSVVFGSNPQGATDPATAVMELALLVNDRVAYTQTKSQVVPPDPPVASPIVSDTWNADLVNPIVLGARDRLGLRVGLMLDQPDTTNETFYVGIQMAPAGGGVAFAPCESTISYRVLDVPASRRL